MEFIKLTSLLIEYLAVAIIAGMVAYRSVQVVEIEGRRPWQSGHTVVKHGEDSE